MEMRAAGDYSWIPATTEKVTRPSLNVTGLREGVQYEFRVTAENKVGRGPTSDPSRSSKAGKYFYLSSSTVIILYNKFVG